MEADGPGESIATKSLGQAQARPPIPEPITIASNLPKLLVTVATVDASSRHGAAPLRMLAMRMNA
jgi:hypothetical protein